MSSSLVYWVLALNSIVCTLACIVLISLVVSAVTGFVVFRYIVDEETDSEEFKVWRRALRITATVLVVSWVGLIFTPTTKQMAAILILPKIANSEFVQETVSKDSKMLYELTVDYIKSKVQEGKK